MVLYGMRFKNVGVGTFKALFFSLVLHFDLLNCFRLSNQSRRHKSIKIVNFRKEYFYSI